MHGVRTERVGRVAIVNASGELDAFAAPDLEAAFGDVHGADRVLADLASVSFMDSTVLGLLVRHVRELGEAEVGVRVVLPRGTASRIFEITTLDRVLPVARDRASALEDLGA
jgi:anti-anti-sigma factor